MATVKFRVRCSETKKIAGYEWLEDGGWKHTAIDPDDGSIVGREFPGTLKASYIREQYTGVHSSDGVEIYEGDVLCYDNVQDRWVAAVGFMVDEGAWGIRALDDSAFDSLLRDFSGPHIKIIGDIHDPEYAELAK